MNLWCKDTTVCAINSIFSVDFYTFYWANVCTICPIRLQFILKMFHCMTPQVVSLTYWKPTFV